MEPTFCNSLPKLELHAHLNGSISHKTLLELYEYQKVNGVENLELDSSIFEKNTYLLSEFFQIFKMTYALTSTPDAVQMATERVIQDFNEDNVIYLELRSTLRKESCMSKRNYIESMIKGVLECRKRFPKINVKLLISVNRGDAIESGMENVRIAIEYFKKYPDIVVGVDLSGDCTKNNFNDYVHILRQARSEGIKCSIHCGEVVNNEEVKNILDFHPDRLGHGTCIHESFGGNQTNWDELLKRKIPVELCPTSNVKCKTVESYEKHHFQFLYSASHPIVLATDDKGVFGSSLSEEFEIIQKTFGLSNEEMWKLSYNSINHTFANESEKTRLREILDEWKKSNLLRGQVWSNP